MQIKYYSPSLLGQDSDHPFCVTILVLSLWRVWLKGNTSDGEVEAEVFVVLFSASTVVCQRSARFVAARAFQCLAGLVAIVASEGLARSVAATVSWRLVSCAAFVASQRSMHFVAIVASQRSTRFMAVVRWWEASESMIHVEGAFSAANAKWLVMTAFWG